MIRYSSLVAVGIACLFALACSNSKPSTMDSDTRTGSKFGGPTTADSLFFTFERTPCFGPCSAYRIKLYRSGYATYEGMSNVEKIGMHQAWIGADTLADLLAEAERIGFFGMQDKYDAQVTDLPSTFIGIISGNRNKTIQARYNVPAELKAYAIHVDELLLPVAWRPIEPAH